MIHLDDRYQKPLYKIGQIVELIGDGHKENEYGQIIGYIVDIDGTLSYFVKVEKEDTCIPKTCLLKEEEIRER